MKIICLLLSVFGAASAAPAKGFVFPDERRERKLEPIITPPVLPVLEHLERDPSTLLPSEKRGSGSNQVKPRFGFGGGFNVAPSPGGLTASISSSASGAGASQSASQSFSFGFNKGSISASQSASQAASFNGFGSQHPYSSSGFSGSQASSQAASFSGGSASAAASQAASFNGGNHGGSGSQSASSAFGFNNLSPYEFQDNFGDGLLDIRHRGGPNVRFPFPPGFTGRSKGVGAAAFRSGFPSQRSKDDFLAVLVSD